MYRISDIKLNLKEDEDILIDKLCKKLKTNKSDILFFSIYKKSLDARKKDNIHFTYTLDFETKSNSFLKNPSVSKLVTEVKKYEYEYPKVSKKFEKRPVVIGFGPAGIFAALLLSELGLNPVVFERGESSEDRLKTVEKLWKDGVLNEESNIQFGEGGAGAFSDGKLTSRSKNPRCKKVLEDMVKCGAKEDIIYSAKPHIGTDKLRLVIKNLREKIISLGGEVRFNSKVTDFETENGKLKAVIINGKERFETENAILCIGHSARDTFSVLKEKKVSLSKKAFAVGVRIEHLQENINKCQFGKEYKNKKLKAAEYALTHVTKDGRGVYTFCMCPGGEVVLASSEKGRLCTNGMSYSDRGDVNANSAVLVQVKESDIKSDDPLSGIYFQRELEEKAFVLGGSNYNAPVQLLKDFFENKASENLEEIKSSIKPGFKCANLREIFPDFINNALEEGLMEFSKKLSEFKNPNAVLTGVEARSSSPVRIDRNDDTHESINLKGLYPCGEGAGYAGGIISAAIDGLLKKKKMVSERE